MSSGFLPQLVRISEGINQRFAGDAGNKSTAGNSNLLRGTMKSLFYAKLRQANAPTKFKFQHLTFFENRG
jgi:hypothetical protein